MYKLMQLTKIFVNISRCFNISLGVVRSLPWGPRGRAVKTIDANAGGRGFEPHRE